MQPTHACSLELLKTSLTEALGEAEETRLAEHLSHCSFCQGKLAEFAAVEGTWRQVTEVLKSESKELQARNDYESKLTGTSISTRAQSSRDALTDFAVDFFEACDYPDAIGQLGDVAILEVIGHGGMGVVLKGFQSKLNRPVTVKVLAPHLATSGAARQRFAREAQAVAVISHPNVMPIFAVDDSGQLPFIVMPYFDCESLQDRIDRCGPLPVLDSLRILSQVADGLAAAHEQGIVHRDIKPANVLIERGVNRVMLTDFGLARAADDASLTRTGVIAGTPQFMSPEQARGDSIDTRSDLFSLGSTLYTMLAGRPPFRAESSYGILRRITDTEPRSLCEVNPDVPQWLAQYVARLMTKRIDTRIATAQEVAQLARATINHLQQPHQVALPPELDRKLRARHALQTSLSLLFVIAAMIVTYAVIEARVLRPQRAERPSAAVSPEETMRRDMQESENFDSVRSVATDDLPFTIPSTRQRSTTTTPQWDDGIASELSEIEQQLDALEASILP